MPDAGFRELYTYYYLLMTPFAHLKSAHHIAPLAVLRMAFGAIMFISVTRFMGKGWVTDFYVKPQFYFTFYGFHWVKPLGETGMCATFAVMATATLFMMAGFFYRIATLTFLLCFTYVELIDKTNYLNYYYYFISIFTFLLLLKITRPSLLFAGCVAKAIVAHYTHCRAG